MDRTKVKTERFWGAIGTVSDVVETTERLKIDSLTNGWSQETSGPCCDKCRLESRHFTGHGDAIKAVANCRNPFQIATVCQCHIPTRKAVMIAVNSRIEFILEMLKASRAQEIVNAALAYCEAHKADYTTLRESDSADVDAEFMLLFQAVMNIDNPTKKPWSGVL